jgi:hypothetical protein
MNTSNQEILLDLRSRCIQAEHLRMNGEPMKADAIEPSLEEIRAGLIALRSNRDKQTETKTQSSKTKASIPLDLGDLFSSPSTEPTPTPKTGETK